MANPNKTRGQSPKEKPALQLTSYQLVMAICALLLVVCVVFIAGIMVQRLNESKASREAAAIPQPPVSATPVQSKPAPVREGVQVAPRPVTLPPEPSKAGSVPPSKALTERDTPVKYIPAPPPRREGEKTAPAVSPGSGPNAETKLKEPVKPAIPGAPAVPAPVAVPEMKAAAEPPTVEPPKPEVTSPSPEPVASEPKPSTPAKPAAFTIQVASFDAGNLDRAKTFKRMIEEKGDFKVDLVPSKDGKLVRAFVGSFPDRESADKARETMSKIQDFKGCFVKSLAE